MQNPESVGTALKTLTMYLRAAKTEAESAGLETDGMASSVAKLREELLQLTGGRLDIQSDDNNFKSTFQILKELSEIWDEIGEKSGDVTQANILNLLGGKLNANVLASIITNFKDAIDAAETAGDSMGSAWAENEKYLDSIEGKTKQVQAAFETLANSVINSGLVKSFMDMQSGILNIATSLNEIGALLPTLTALSVVVRNIKDSITASRTSNSIVSMLVGGQSKDSALALLNNLTMSQQAMVGLRLESFSGIADGIDDVAQAALAGSGAVTTLGGAVGGLKLAMNGLGAAMKASLPGLLISGGIALANAAINASKMAKQAAEESIRAAEELQSKYDKATASYESNMKTLEGMRDRFEELSKGAAADGTQGSLSTEEYEEYLDLVRKIVQTSPGLADHYQNIGDAIRGGYVDALKEAIAYQKELLKYEQDSYIAKGEDLFDGYAEKNRQIRDDIVELNNSLSTTIVDLLYDNLDASEVKEAQKQIDQIFQMSTGEALWDTKPMLSNIEEMLGFYTDIEDTMGHIATLTREVTDETGKTISVPLFGEDELREIRTGLRAYADAAKSYREVKNEVLSYLYTYIQVDLNDMYEQIPVDAIGDFRKMLAEVIDPAATLGSNKEIVEAFVHNYVSALANIKKTIEAGLGEDELEAAFAELEEKYKAFPSLVDMIRVALFGAEEASDSAGGAAQNAAKSYDDLAASLSNVIKAISFLQKARTGGGSTFEMIEAAQQFVDMMREVEGVDIEVDNLFTVNDDGTLKWETTVIEEYIEMMIRAAFAGTELAETHPEIVEALIKEAKAFDDASKSAASFSDAINSVASISDIQARIAENDGTSESTVELLNDLRGVVDKWNEISGGGHKLGDFISYGPNGIDFSNANAQLMAYQTALFESSEAMQALDKQFPGFIDYVKTLVPSEEEASKATLTMADALGAVSDVMEAMSRGISGDTTVDKLLNASKLAETVQGVLKAAGSDVKFSWADFLVIDKNGARE